VLEVLVFVLAVLAVLDVEPLIVEAVVFAVAEGVALEPVCFPVAAPAVTTTGTNVTSLPDTVAVCTGGSVVSPEIAAPVDEPVQIAWVLPMSWQLRDSVL